MSIDFWFYIGGILSYAGVALLAIGLVFLSASKADATVRLKRSRYFAIGAAILLIVGICIQLHRLLA